MGVFFFKDVVNNVRSGQMKDAPSEHLDPRDLHEITKVSFEATCADEETTSKKMLRTSVSKKEKLEREKSVERLVPIFFQQQS